jgi:hypothetical protein
VEALGPSNQGLSELAQAKTLSIRNGGPTEDAGVAACFGVIRPTTHLSLLAEGVSNMKRFMFVSFAFALLASAVSLAQDAATPPNTTASAQAKQDAKTVKPKTVTGCLTKGNQPGEVTLTAADGKTWDLRSDSVKLEEHIGHQVSATGTVTHETKAEEKKEGQVEKAASKEAYGDLNVTEVKMVSETCTK